MIKTHWNLSAKICIPVGASPFDRIEPDNNDSPALAAVIELSKTLFTSNILDVFNKAVDSRLVRNSLTNRSLSLTFCDCCKKGVVLSSFVEHKCIPVKHVLPKGIWLIGSFIALRRFFSFRWEMPKRV